MKKNTKLRIALLGVGLFALGIVQAQDASDDAADVWSVIEAEWDDNESNKRNHLERVLTDDFMGWGKNSPAPRSKDSTIMWDRFNHKQGEMLAHELYPLSIVVHNDVAIAHYLYTSAYDDKDGKVEVTNGRYTDVLVRTDDDWKFIAWHGGDDE